MIINKIISLIKDAQKIAILNHISADGDSLGSSFALAMALKKLNKDVTVFLEEEIPDIYSFLPGKEMSVVYNAEKYNYEIAIALDTGDLQRLGKRMDIFDDAGITVNIDHHATNSMYAEHNFVQTSASSVGEIIYQVIKMMGMDLDEDMATCLYVSLATDTGGFRYSNTTAITHQIAGDLINNGVNVSEVSQKIFENMSFEKTRLMGLAIDSIELFHEGKVAVISITDEMVKNAEAKEEDCDGIVNIARNIRGVEVAAMLKEKDDEVKVNLRSKSYVDVSKIAEKFLGGGHKRAAGCRIKGDFHQVKKDLLANIEKELLV